GVVHVAEDPADTPFVGRVTDRRLFLGNAAQQLERFLSLVREDAADVRTRHPVDVLEVVLGRLGPIRCAYHTLHRAPPLGSIADPATFHGNPASYLGGRIGSVDRARSAKSTSPVARRWSTRDG